ncbi:hypothetical protein EVG20_g3428 [Dentipellis fragilis]|uniref:Uncharacterized protein n=1 Tax=Dentipellis fragilis TaxID=205917 RepID=A0A4Y9Z3Z1_9AGAM|nr:hypothetical protein EVG20_g3428 [Dentipellis fragilis]
MASPTVSVSPTVQATPPPILQLLPLLSRTFSASVSASSYIARNASSALSLFLTPLTLMLPAVLYVFAPFIVTSQILLDAFVVIPYRVTVYILQVVYPLYVFVGVACICGALLGFGARQVVKGIVWVILGDGAIKSIELEVPQQQNTPSRVGTRRRSSMKGKRRSVKVEGKLLLS